MTPRNSVRKRIRRKSDTRENAEKLELGRQVPEKQLSPLRACRRPTDGTAAPSLLCGEQHQAIKQILPHHYKMGQRCNNLGDMQGTAEDR